MEKFLTVVTLLAPLLMLVLVGYMVRRLDYFPASAVKGLATFIAKIAIPVALFRMIAVQDLGEILDVSLILGYLMASSLIAALIFISARGALIANALRSMTMAFGVSTSNAVMIGFPIIPLAFGEAGSAAITILFLAQSCILIPLKLAIWGGIHDGQRPTMGRAGRLIFDAIRNPIIAGILAGMAVAFLRFTFPELANYLITFINLPALAPITAAISHAGAALAMTAGGLALFYIGCSLHGANFLPLARDVTLTAFGKLLGHPIAMLGSMGLMAMLFG